MSENPFRGVIVPMLTPLTADFAVDVPAVGRLVDHILGGGADGIFIMGSAGEGPLLSPDQARTLIAATRKAVGDRAPLLIGVSAPSTAQALANLELAIEGQPAAVVATVPFYLPVTGVDAIADHYRALARAASVPVLAYDIPQFIGWEIPAAAVDLLHGIPNVAGIKLSATDYRKLERLLLDYADDPDFAILLGHSDLFAAGMALGADGLVPVTGNPHPELPVAMWAARQAPLQKLAALVDRHRRVTRRYLGCGDPVTVWKAACHVQGLCEPWVIPPYTTADEDLIATIRRLAP